MITLAIITAIIGQIAAFIWGAVQIDKNNHAPRP